MEKYLPRLGFLIGFFVAPTADSILSEVSRFDPSC
jgi:hypothetical protein